MKIAIGADHRGFQHKEFIKNECADIAWIDVGANNDERSDYPLFAKRVCAVMLQNQAEMGVLICGTGVGMAVAANRYRGIYAGLAWDENIARLGREHDKTNVLVIPSSVVDQEASVAMIRAWLAAEFRNGRYQERINMIDAIPCE